MMLVSMATKSTAADRTSTAAEPAMLVLMCLAAWLAPGAGHLWLGRRQKGLVFLIALAGGCMGFLWYNAHPAEIFMGDVGSLGLGGAMAVVLSVTHNEYFAAAASAAGLPYGEDAAAVSFSGCPGSATFTVSLSFH